MLIITLTVMIAATTAITVTVRIQRRRRRKCSKATAGNRTWLRLKSTTFRVSPASLPGGFFA
jgi:hypothetical protein